MSRGFNGDAHEGTDPSDNETLVWLFGFEGKCNLKDAPTDRRRACEATANNNNNKQQKSREVHQQLVISRLVRVNDEAA